MGSGSGPLDELHHASVRGGDHALWSEDPGLECPHIRVRGVAWGVHGCCVAVVQRCAASQKSPRCEQLLVRSWPPDSRKACVNAPSDSAANE